MATVQADVRKVRQMTQFKDDVPFANLTVTVSTIDLAFTGVGTGFETCLFWADTSEVVASYEKAPDAIRGHKAFCNPDVVAAVIGLRETNDRFA